MTSSAREPRHRRRGVGLQCLAFRTGATSDSGIFAEYAREVLLQTTQRETVDRDRVKSERVMNDMIDGGYF